MSSGAPSNTDNNNTNNDQDADFKTWDKDAWMSKLSAQQYCVTRECGTERAFTGKYWNEHRSGIYSCVCCNKALFASKTKFDSGTGWPSFYDKLGNVKEKNDDSLDTRRVEVVCASCDAHLGHVFEDGPQPTGLRYCINSASLSFEPQSDDATKHHHQSKQ